MLPTRSWRVRLQGHLNLSISGTWPEHGRRSWINSSWTQSATSAGALDSPLLHQYGPTTSAHGLSTITYEHDKHSPIPDQASSSFAPAALTQIRTTTPGASLSLATDVEMSASPMEQQTELLTQILANQQPMVRDLSWVQQNQRDVQQQLQ